MKKLSPSDNQEQPHHHTVIADFLTSIPLDIIVGGACFAASAVCLYRPELASSILFFFVGSIAFFLEVWIKTVAAPSATKTVSNVVTESLQAFVAQENSDDTDRLLDAVSESIARALQSTSLVSTVKSSISETIQDDELQSAVINTLQSALVKVSQNQGFQNTTMDVTRRAFLGALGNEQFVKELMTSVVQAIVSASQDEKLKKAVMSVVTEAVSEALADERFTAEIRGAVKATLKDGELYRAGVSGVLSAALPSLARRSSNLMNQKDP
jgi:hypothetical protein